MVLHKHAGGCHCGNIRVVVELPSPPKQTALRACAPGTCSFCRATGWRTVADPNGVFKMWAEDWGDVTRYRFGTGTADFLACRRCNVYVAAVCETASGQRAVVNVNSLNDRNLFTAEPDLKNFDSESVEERLARRDKNWMPAIVHL